MSTYIHQLPDWPRFRWDQEALATLLADIRHRQGRLLGRMEGLGFALQREAELETLTLDVLKSSEIEGETLNAGQVRSSIARRLGLDAAGTEPADRKIIGVPSLIGVVGATQYINPKTHFFPLSALREAQGERNLEYVRDFWASIARQGSPERSRGAHDQPEQ